jgi:hypothetical protein
MKPASELLRGLRWVFAAWLLLGLAAPVPLLGAAGSLDDTVRDAQQAGFPAETLNRLLAMGYEQKIEADQMITLVEFLSTVRKDGLPLAPFVSKVEEGLTKRIAPSVILQVLQQRKDDYRFVQDLLSTRVRQRDQAADIPSDYLVRLAESHYCGISRGQLEQLVAQAPAVPLVMVVRAVETRAALAQIQFDPQRADHLVALGMERQFFTAERQDLAHVIAAARRKGIPDNRIETTVAAAMETNGGLQDITRPLGVTPQDLSIGTRTKTTTPSSGSRNEPGGPGTGGSAQGQGSPGAGGGPGGGQGQGQGGGGDGQGGGGKGDGSGGGGQGDGSGGGQGGGSGGKGDGGGGQGGGGSGGQGGGKGGGGQGGGSGGGGGKGGGGGRGGGGRG